MVELRDIEKNYTNFDLKINLKINKGEIFGLIGQSGSGKSTILRIIQGILKADKGEINIAKNTETAYIFQEFNLLYNKNVFDNVALPLILKKKFLAEKVEEVLKFVGLSDRKESFIASLSGGERQRVAIARALVTNPQLLLCDEVTASLDKSVKDEILDLFEEINKKYGTTILVIKLEVETLFLTFPSNVFRFWIDFPNKIECFVLFSR